MFLVSIRRIDRMTLQDQPEAKLNKTIIGIHLALLVLTVMSLMCYLGYAASYISPDLECKRKLQMFLAMPRFLASFICCTFLSQMMIFGIVLLYTNATQVLLKVTKERLSTQPTS